MNPTPSSRRAVLKGAALAGAASSGLLLPEWALAQTGKIRVGLMLPYSGAFAPLGVALENGVRMAIQEQGGKLGGREIEWYPSVSLQEDFGTSGRSSSPSSKGGV